MYIWRKVPSICPHSSLAKPIFTNVIGDDILIERLVILNQPNIINDNPFHRVNKTAKRFSVLLWLFSNNLFDNIFACEINAKSSIRDAWDKFLMFETVNWLNAFMYSIWGTWTNVLNTIAWSFFGKITFADVFTKVFCVFDCWSVDKVIKWVLVKVVHQDEDGDEHVRWFLL